MKPRPLRVTLALCFSLLVCPPNLRAQTVSFEVLAEFAYPGALSTAAWDINDAGDVVGNILLEGSSRLSGFQYYADGSVSMPIVFPGSDVTNTMVFAINNEGTIAGSYVDSTGSHGFFFSGGVYTSYDHPDGVFGTFINGINDAGDFVGTYSPESGVSRDFASVGGQLHSVTLPGVQFPRATDINNHGDIVGFADSDAGSGGFRRDSRGAVRFPLQRESGVFDVFYGTNETREAVGQENGATGLYFGGRDIYVLYNFPNLVNNTLTGINRHGVICGSGFSSRDLKVYSYLVQRVVTRTGE